MTMIEVAHAQAQLQTLIHGLAPGEELTIAENGVPVATLKATRPGPSQKRVAGLWVGKATVLAEDNEHLKDFAEYME